MNFDFNPKVLTWSGPQDPIGKGGVSLTTLGIKETLEVLGRFKQFISINTARAVSGVLTHLLANAQPRVPVDTGELRESGRATLNLGYHTITVGKGKKDGTAQFFLGNVRSSLVGKATEISGDVTYFRLNEEGKDIALWTHEDLFPYGSGKHPRARTPGTGPKYLENTWLQYEKHYIDFLKDSLSGQKFENELSKVSRLKQKRVGLYTLDYVDLVFLDNI
jgi:hypothetical protein